MTNDTEQAERNERVAIERLRGIGVEFATAEDLANRHELSQIILACERTEKRSDLANPPGFVVALLKGTEQGVPLQPRPAASLKYGAPDPVKLEPRVVPVNYTPRSEAAKIAERVAESMP